MHLKEKYWNILGNVILGTSLSQMMFRQLFGRSHSFVGHFSLP